MDDQDQRALNALLDIIADRKMWIGRRVEAAGTYPSDRGLMKPRRPTWRTAGRPRELRAPREST